MRANRILRQMAGIGESPYDKLMKRHKRQIDRRARVLTEEAMLLEMISRRQAGAEGTAPMPFKTIRADLEKMAKGEL
jgi:predicted transcriptional regulator